MYKDEILEILRSIQTVDDFIQKKDSLLESVKKMMNYNLETLKKLKNSGLSKEELAPELTKFQQNWEAIGNEIEPEFARLDTIPGIDKYGKKLFEDFQNILEPIAKEGEKIMMILGIAGLPENTGTAQGPQYSAPPTPQTRNIERQKLKEFEAIYEINSIEELESSKNMIIDSIEEKVKEKLERLRSFKGKPKEEYMSEFEEISNYLDIFDNEFKSEFERLSALHGGAEYIGKLQEELVGRMGSLFDEMEQLLEQLK